MRARGDGRASERGWGALVVAIALTRGLLYAALIPPWQAPDELGHFEQAWLVARLGRFPTPQDMDPQLEKALIASLYEWRYGDYLGRPLPAQIPERLADFPPGIFAAHARTLGRPSLAYVWQALWILPVRHEEVVLSLYLARCSSVVLNALILVVAWRLFSELMPEQPALARAMTLVLAFHPQHTFINAAVGEGPMAELGATLALYGWIRILIRGWGWDTIAVAIGGTVLGVMTKGTTLFLIPLFPVALSLGMTFGIRRHPLRALLGGALGLMALGLLAWWLPHTPGAGLLDHLVEAWRSGELALEENNLPPLDQRLGAGVESYWFNLGWMNVPAPRGWYLLLWVAMFWALEGWVLPRSRGPRVPRRVLILMIAAAGLAVGGWVAFLLTPSGAPYYQGRYVFPAAVPLTFLLVGGWARALPEAAQERFPLFVAAAMAFMEAVAFFPTTFSVFYGRKT